MRTLFSRYPLVRIFAAALLLAALVPAATAAAAWQCFRGNPARTGVSELAGPPESIELKWRWRIEGDSAAVTASPAVADDGSIAVGTTAGTIALLDPAGGPGWIRSVGGEIAASPAFDDAGNLFVINSSGYAYYLSPSGTEYWKSDLPDSVVSSPVVTEGYAYFGSNGCDMWALATSQPMSGKIHPSYLEGWQERLGYDRVKSAPAYSGSTLYVAAGDVVYALNPTIDDNATEEDEQSRIKWSYAVDGDVVSAPAVYDGVVYVTTTAGYLYALYENPVGDRIRKWRSPYRYGAIHSSPAVTTYGSETRIYFGSDDHHVYAYNDQGKELWSYATQAEVRSSPAVDADGDIYVGSNDCRIYALYPEKGAVKWVYMTAGMVTSSPAIGPDQRLYVGSEDGFVYCIGPNTQDDAKPELNIDLSLSLDSIEVNGNPTTLRAAISSDTDENILSRISSVTVNLFPLLLIGCDTFTGTPPDVTNLDNLTDIVNLVLTRVPMYDDGNGDDIAQGDGTYTYSFGITDDPLFSDLLLGCGVNDFFTHYAPLGVNVRTVPLMVTVTMLGGSRVSKPIPLGLSQKLTGTPSLDNATDPTTTFTNGLSRQTLVLEISSGQARILSITPSSGAYGQRVDIFIIGENTNFRSDFTRVEIFNEDSPPVRIAYALPEDDDIDYAEDTFLFGTLNIASPDQIDNATLTGKWDVTVTTEAPSYTEVVVGRDKFQITSSSSTTSETRSAAAPERMLDDPYADCFFNLDVRNNLGGRPFGFPIEIAAGRTDVVSIPNARYGKWDVYLSADSDACDITPAYKIIVSGDNIGYLTGEVKGALAGLGLDFTLITAIAGNLAPSPTISSAGGYYMLPLPAVRSPYMVVATNALMTAVETDIEIAADNVTRLDISLAMTPCPISETVTSSALGHYHAYRDTVLSQTPAGQRWIGLYYQHAAEVSVLLDRYPRLKRRSRQLLGRVTLLLTLPEWLQRWCYPLVRGRMLALIDDLAAAGSAQLADDLAAERPAIAALLGQK